MKIYIFADGDRSVGIVPITLTIDYPDKNIATVGFTREVFRVQLQSFWTEELQEHVTVLFEDECVDCCRLKTECKCPRETKSVRMLK